MASLNALSGIVRTDRERFLNAAARRYQTSTGSSARYNALELLLIHVADALGSSEATRLERWVQREVRDIPAASIIDSLRAVSFAILDAIEAQRELFDAALLRLGHLEKRVADSIAVADAHLGIRQALDRKIFPELSEGKITAAEMSFPVTIGVGLVHHYRAMLSSMSGKISLPVAHNVQPANHAPALHRLLPNAGVNGLPPPRDIARQTYVD